jgi:hypothetical protein
MALYVAGPWETPQLHVLAADGTMTDLAHRVHRGATASFTGRWVASLGSPPPTETVQIADLEGSTRYTIPTTADTSVQGMAFHRQGTRLAFVEIGPPTSERIPWAIVEVVLADGSTTRFEGTTGEHDPPLPGTPLAWPGSDELFLNTFLPYTEEGSTGLWGLSLPPDTAAAPIATLETRLVLTGTDYLFQPELAPGGQRFLYLNRDYDYTPADYEPRAYDLAVHQLGLVALGGTSSRLLVDVTDGGALAGAAAWSPDGTEILFAEGRYAGGDTFGPLTLKTLDVEAGTTRELGAAPLPERGTLVSLDWCAPRTALAVVATWEGAHQLHTLDLETGESQRLVDDDFVQVLGCVREGTGEGATANADVTHVRAVRTGDGTWTFHVTVRHPDTGWEDYADGWDVVTPDGQVLKPDPGSPFTRELLHPHVDEQPFTRSQSGIEVPAGVTQVRVRAHDLVDGFGGREVNVDLTADEGPNFEVTRE